ncbi:MAG: [protein-PII] uridylyltransferase [Rhodobiaceae bacterium]|nr:[protein-PII] uridylyltransferase [Rhodobiaceae bacterium]|tara:strand:+ start:32198 stop:34948 length:2751 start_codon:yes stop_codon:yes gene_type:complete
MNQKVDKLININDLRSQILEISNDGDVNQDKLRSHIFEILKDHLIQARNKSEDGLFRHGSGIRTARSISKFQDELIKIIYDFAIHHIFMSKNPTESEKVCLVAVGGYGRGTLAPFSDIDLLFLYPNKLTAWAESVIEFILYMLWDLGFKVGHATRNVDQCLNLSKSDFTIRTSILEARYIHGDIQLFKNLNEKFNKNIIAKTADEFIEMKLDERNKRHTTYGSSRYLVEPNIKESKGGLRDLHTLFWISKYLFRPEKPEDLINSDNFLTKSELNSFQKAEDFLWAIRCHLHFISNRENEVLTFDKQLELASRLGYSKRPGQKDVERFMKHYFMTAKDVGNLTRIVCASLEEKSIKKEPTSYSVIDNLLNFKRNKVSNRNFSINKGRLSIRKNTIFEDSPVDLIRLFVIADRENVLLSPDIVQRITRSLRFIDKNIQINRTANRLFLELFSQSSDPEKILRKMNETGVLGRFIPEFRKIEGMSLFNLYHNYTVDEHLLKTTGNMYNIISNKMPEPHPFSNIIIGNLENRKVLLIAAFLHDIGKGRKQDHSLLGSQIAERLCKRLGLKRSEINDISWLITNHLLMSDIAQKRDLYDPKTISDFAKIIQNQKNLDSLLALTVADILSVGPSIWNAWKNGLLKTLHYQTTAFLTGNDKKYPKNENISLIAKETFKKNNIQWPSPILKSYVDRFNDSYWITTDLALQIEHSKILRDKDSSNISLEIFTTKNEESNTTIITLIGPDYPNLLSTLAGACLLYDVNIVDAQIETTIDGIAIDTISVKREFSDNDEDRRIKKIADTIKKSLGGSLSLSKELLKKKHAISYEKTFKVDNIVSLTNEFSNYSTVIEVEARDKPGLLYQITNTLRATNINIKSAHIATFGERANDVFYVTNLFDEKIDSEEKIDRIKKLLISNLEENN